ncbi:DUF2306 domain-containing protein [Mucilaginibacter sp. KACC 22063]|uniref:DUF2306 domain-containing protein n=1 Tax=Mucilaginibacter sp. KACC 22063 TaxID=3025666 RepID=UPI002366EA5D|nr:DUF2306 domain-containing protein [Mucilaginibacter sp. KACC 22063]WDF53893.1 DUF2306 domain-containing protein [Mucilaginibacter sp. KACC 22063]
MKKLRLILLALLSVLIGLYPLFYYLNKGFGLLKSKPAAIVANAVWHTSFYIHITFGGIALLIGWMQFSPKIRDKRITLHRQIGKIYIVSVLLSALAGFYIAFYAMTGAPAALGFISLSIIWFYTTLMGYLRIVKGNLIQHQKMMIYSYACCFAAVTLRLWLPILSIIFGNFETAYIIVAWWCWIPNLIVAYFIIRKTVYTKLQ